MSGNSLKNHNHIRDNRDLGKVSEFLKEKIKKGSELSVVSAYFTIYAYDALRDQLEQIDRLKFLFGEPRFITLLDPNKTDGKAFKIEDDHLNITQRLRQKDVARRCAGWIKRKVEIRSIREANFMHGKLYHIDDGRREHAILGSSNFTSRGLGLSATPNLELNLIVDSDRDRADLKAWFEGIWNDDLVEDVRESVLKHLEQLYINHSPKFVYFKTLYHVFEKFLSEQQEGEDLLNRTVLDSQIWGKLYDFQKDAAKAAIHKINSHNGCILADSVGLGKTFTALAVIKYFELRENARVLVLCPRKLRDNWTLYQARNNSELNEFLEDRFAYTVLSHTDLSRDSGTVDGIDLSTFNWSNFNLVVIDESHNFRNKSTGKGDAYGNYRKSRYEKLIDDIIKSGIPTKVMLLSATPVNNSLMDLRNQIYLISEESDSKFADSLGIKNISDTINFAQKKFAIWTKKDSQIRQELMNDLPPGLFKLLDALTIARSRKQLQRHYSSSLSEIGEFPGRNPPRSEYSLIDKDKVFQSYEELHDVISEYKLSLFNPSKYILDEFKHHYEQSSANPNFLQVEREKSLIGMMKVSFLKRLESSIHSFHITMERTVEKIENLINRLGHYKHQSRAVMGSPFFEPIPIEEDQDEEDPDSLEQFKVGGKLQIRMDHLDLDKWLEDLEHDKRQIASLEIQSSNITPSRDAKLHKLRSLIKEKINNPSTNRENEKICKVIVFSAFADTASYLYENLNGWVKTDLGKHIALVTGNSADNKTTLGNRDFAEILVNFSPRSKNRNKKSNLANLEKEKKEIDILIATDCISEGQNLQDCDWVVNYDIHWNPVRIIQRFGRIDRIGSLHNNIQLINFWPTDDLDKYINLKGRVDARMELANITATADDNILINEGEDQSAKGITQSISRDRKHYRDQQLIRLKDEILDIEDLNESISLHEFTLDGFRMELANYINTNKEKLERAPFGIYAVVPPKPEPNLIKPGVIFCLKQRNDLETPENTNPLSPYFLVYVRNDGEVRYSYVAPKKILEIFRILCLREEHACQKLCELFDRRTDNGEDMGQFDNLLKISVKEIIGRLNAENIGSLFGGKGGRLVNDSMRIKDENDFDLITWLIILDQKV